METEDGMDGRRIPLSLSTVQSPSPSSPNRQPADYGPIGNHQHIASRVATSSDHSRSNRGKQRPQSSAPIIPSLLLPIFLVRLPPPTSSLGAILGYRFKVTRSARHLLVTTTVSRFFTDKSVGAVPPDQASEDPPAATHTPPKRPSFLHRLHIHSSSKKPKPPALTIRPTTSSSLPVRSSSKPRPGSSHSDAVTIAEMTNIMPQSLNLNTPPQSSNKRQRSRDSRKDPSRPGSAGQTASTPPVTDVERLARYGIRLPSYLSKSKSEITLSFQDLEWKQRYRLAGAFQNPNSPFRIDRSNHVVNRNRYNNVQPWDGSRIKLRTPIGGSDYVNASPIILKSLTSGSRQRGRRKTPEGVGGSDMQAFNIQETRYIATQGPKDGQFSHFWHMATQQSTGEVGVIVMLTQCYEGLKEKCAEYFPLDMENPIMLLPPEPQNEESSHIDSDGDPFLDSDSSSADTDSDHTGITTNDAPSTDDEESAATQTNTKEHTEAGSVELLSVHTDPSIGSEVRELKVTIGNTSKHFYHFFYGNWADFGRIEPEDRVALLQLTRVSKQLAGDSPRIVHCSAGVGRTGTWITLDFLLRELEEGRLLDQSYFQTNIQPKAQSPDQQQSPELGEAKAETWGKSGPPKTTTPEPKENDLIHDTVDLLRTQRMMMVMNEIQYGSLYEVLRDQFVDKYAEKEVGPVVGVEVEEPSPKVPRTMHGGVREGKVGGLMGDECVSEAETEIEGEKADVSMSEARGNLHGRSIAVAGSGADGDDPYAAADPSRVMDGMGGEGWETDTGEQQGWREAGEK